MDFQYKIFDIETGPMPYIKRAIRELYPFDPDSVKCGNIKDPEKIAEKVRQAEADHFAKHEERAALDPKLGRVVAVGSIWQNGNGFDQVDILMADTMSEAELIRAFWQLMDPHAKFIGWNSHGFDLPFMVKRSWLHRIHVPKFIFSDRGWARQQIDLMKVYCNYQYGEYAKLSDAAAFLDVAQPRKHRVHGKDFHKVLKRNPDRARAYLRDDLIETRDIANIIL